MPGEVVQQVLGRHTAPAALYPRLEMLVHHPALFERAYDFSFWEQHGQQTQQYDLGLKRQPNGSDANLTALRHAISAFYKRELQCGDGSVAHLVERSPGVFLLSVHVKDMAMLRLEFEGATLKRRVGNPNIHMVLEYAKSTGVVRTLVRGGAKYQQMLVDAFAEHVLGVKASAHKIKSPTLDLSMLRTGFDVPEVFEDGFSMVQLKALTLLSPDTALKIKCTAMQSSQQRSVHDLLKEKLPGPLEGQWAVTAAQVNWRRTMPGPWFAACSQAARRRCVPRCRHERYRLCLCSAKRSGQQWWISLLCSAPTASSTGRRSGVMVVAAGSAGARIVARCPSKQSTVRHWP